MKRMPINPWGWSLHYGFNQGELIDGQSRVLYCSGQASIDTNGVPQHAGDIRAQIMLSLDNLEQVLRHAEMTLPVKPFKNLTVEGIILPFKNLTQADRG